ncbi:GNAT family N-acetyltransferase [Kitasatospora sp. NPDC002965]|uniref:GNAT family N-acetyltransferase n=1 Tax=Kitasatospora sp. NPDC002965 TaxID=3154775 RepID=UPI0033A14A7E
MTHLANGVIRPFWPATDYPALAALLSSAGPEQVTAAELRAQDEVMPPVGSLATDPDGLLIGHGRIRLVDPGPSGGLLAFATAWRAPWTPPGDVASLVVGTPGRAPELLLPLLDGIEDWAHGAGARRLLGELPDHGESAGAAPDADGADAHRSAGGSGGDGDGEGRDSTDDSGRSARGGGHAGLLDLLIARGHRIDAHIRTATARLEPRTLAPPPPLGIDLRTLATSGAPQPARQLHRLYRETLSDNPGFADAVPGFERWHAEALSGQGCRPDWVFTAEAAGRIVGVTAVRETADPRVCHIDFTGVLRSWRGRGLARTLKLHAARHLASRGVRTACTEVEASNIPMIAVNSALGYEWGPGHRRLVKLLRPAGNRRPQPPSGRREGPNAARP